MKVIQMKTILLIISSLCLGLLTACGDGSSVPKSNSTATPASSLVAGYAVDDFLIGATAKLINGNGVVVATTTTGEFGYFEFLGIPLADYRVEIRGGLQDTDGKLVTTNDQRENTAVLTAMSLSGERSKTMIVSAFTTGSDKFAGGNVELYKKALQKIESSLSGSTFIPVGADAAASLKVVAAITERVGGFTTVVRELQDDGLINGTQDLPSQALADASVISSNYSKSGFDDPALLDCVLSSLGAVPQTYTPAVFESVTNLFCSSKGINSLKGIEKLKNLESINLQNNKLTNISELGGLNRLETINVGDNRLSSIVLSRSTPVQLAVAGNCLPTGVAVPSNIEAQGLTRRQRDVASCTLPTIRSLEAIFKVGKGLTVAYNVQDAQGLSCSVVAGPTVLPAICDGTTRIVHTSAIDLVAAKTLTVKFLVAGKALESTEVEVYGETSLPPEATPTVTIPPSVTTLAGTGIRGNANGASLSSSFNAPYAIAVDVAGNKYVADTGNNLIRKISFSGVVSTLAGSGSKSFADGLGISSAFFEPTGIGVDAAGNVYVSEAYRIRKITPAGVVTTLAGGSAAGFIDGTGSTARFRAIFGIAVDSAGNVFAADFGSHSIRKVSSSGVVTTVAGNGTAGFADGIGTAARLNTPMSLAIDGTGNLYVSDDGNKRIRKITPNGVVSTFAGSGEGGDLNGAAATSSFSAMRGLAVNAATGVVYVVAGGVVRQILDGEVSAYVGSTTKTFVNGTLTSSGFVDGNGDLARFNDPFGLAIDSSGTLFVADIFNHSIRKIVP